MNRQAANNNIATTSSTSSSSTMLQQESHNNIDSIDAMGDNSTPFPLGFIFAGLGILLVIIIVFIETAKKLKAVREYNNFLERAKKKKKERQQQKAESPPPAAARMVITVGCDEYVDHHNSHTTNTTITKNNNEYHFHGKLSDSSFYQTRVLPEIDRGWFYRSRLRRNIGPSEIDIRGVMCIAAVADDNNERIILDLERKGCDNER